MSTIEIINAHYQSNLKRYEAICKSYFKGRDIYKDMLSLLYLEFLKVKPGVIEEFSEKGILYKIGLRILRDLYSWETRPKKHIDGRTGELFELTALQAETLDWTNNESTKDNESWEVSITISKDHTHARLTYREDQIPERAYSKMNEAIIQCLNDPNQSFNTTIFLQAQETSISEISKKSGISRFYLTRAYKEAQKNLKNRIK